MAAYLEWEASQTGRYEWHRGQLVERTGLNDAHNRIVGNVAVSLMAQLRGTRCRVFASAMKLKVEAADAVFYPDVFVTCDERDRGVQADLV